MKLELEIVKQYDAAKVCLESGLVAFRIKEQEGFTHCKTHKASNGINICSASCPTAEGNDFYIRGGDKTRDDAILVVTKEKFAKLQAAIKEVLERENAPKVIKRVTFFYENGAGERSRRLVDVTEDGGEYIKGTDLDKKEFRNFLKTRIEGSVTTVPS